MEPLKILENNLQTMTLAEFLIFLKETKISFNKIKNLLLLYTEYDYSKTKFQKYCNSLILDIHKKKVITYMYPDVIDVKSITDICNYYDDVSIEYSGIPLTIFNNSDIWYISTKKNIIDKKNILYTFYNDIVEKMGFGTVNDFHDTLNKDCSYYFLLMHHENKYYKNYYNELFGEKYMFLYLLSIMDEKLNKLDIKNYNIENVNNYIKYIDKIEYNDIQEKFKDKNIPGVILQKFNNKVKLYDYYRYSNYNYLNDKYKSHNNLIYYLFLYKNNTLHHENLIKVDNKDCSGLIIINKLLKHLSYEITYLYYLFWTDDKLSNVHMNERLYLEIPTIYKNILFGVRGKYINNILSFEEHYNISIFKLSYLLKSYSIEFIISLLHARTELANIFNNINNYIYLINNNKINNILNEYMNI